MRVVYSERVEKYLAAGYGEGILKDPGAANAVAETILRNNGIDYAIHAYCVMPNHVHVIVGDLAEGIELRKIVSIWKRASAHRINSALSRTGEVWQRDTYTHIIRNSDEYKRQLSYVWVNPEVAGLVDGYKRERFVRW